MFHINGSLEDMRFTSTTSDPCVYTLDTNNTFSILTLFVDDLILLGGSPPVRKKLKPKPMELFTMADMRGVSPGSDTQITGIKQPGP